MPFHCFSATNPHRVLSRIKVDCREDKNLPQAKNEKKSARVKKEDGQDDVKSPCVKKRDRIEEAAPANGLRENSQCPLRSTMKNENSKDEGQPHSPETYTEWVDAKDLATEASDCGDRLHPGFPDQDMKLCPICLVVDILKTLRNVANNWNKLGGPFGRLATTLNNHSGLWLKWSKEFQKEKLEFARFLYALDICIESERTWEKKNKELIRRAGGFLVCNSATLAALKARQEMPYAIQAPDKPKRRQTEKKKKKKRVSFLPDTPDTRQRYLLEFNRGSVHYAPGRYAPEFEDGYEDTSFHNDPAYGVSVSKRIMRDASRIVEEMDDSEGLPREIAGKGAQNSCWSFRQRKWLKSK
ncbi:hypothetical protein GQ43DRAFT_104103 [Delitschia confertaspora ATCC 74209]|uniref:Uncharacterized protein n=1 Tax=Delitschia confertaspora ATCC 74209 TaxID=1513339 RepID=A0A9P4JN00_9PLEO|nr:hypothetical protein GQ43DRAFT_104103 [Delitschia confertaspora ATCC 74209]